MTALLPFHQPAHLFWMDVVGSHLFVFDNVIAEEWKNGATITEHPVEQGANVADHVRVELPEVTLTIHATNEPMGANQYQQGTVGPTQVTIPTPTWVPGTGFVVVPTWQNFIELRSAANLGLGLVGGNGAAFGIAAAGAIAGQVGGALGVSLSPFSGLEVDEPRPISGALQPSPQAGAISATTETWPGGFDFIEQTIADLIALKDDAQLIEVRGSKQTESNMVIQTLSYSRSSEEGTGAVITLGLKQVRIVATQVVAAPIAALPRATPPVKKGAQNGSDAPPATQESVAAGLVDAARNYFGRGGA